MKSRLSGMLRARLPSRFIFRAALSVSCVSAARAVALSTVPRNPFSRSESATRRNTGAAWPAAPRGACVPVLTGAEGIELAGPLFCDLASPRFFPASRNAGHAGEQRLLDLGDDLERVVPLALPDVAAEDHARASRGHDLAAVRQHRLVIDLGAAR